MRPRWIAWSLIASLVRGEPCRAAAACFRGEPAPRLLRGELGVFLRAAGLICFRACAVSSRCVTSRHGFLRVHQQGSIRVPRAACTADADGGDDKSGCLLQAASVLWGGLEPDRTESLVLFAALDDGERFRYHATIASALAGYPCVPITSFPPSSPRVDGGCWEGPGNENAMTRLTNGSLLAVLRIKYDNAFATSLSLDGKGRTWTTLRALDGIGCCRPRLLQLPAGPLLLSGGRCTPIGPAENHLWVNRRGDLIEWERISLSAPHNRLAPRAGVPTFSAGVNCTAANGTRLPKCPQSETLGYTSLLPLGDRSALIVYSLNSEQCASCAYSMRFRL